MSALAPVPDGRPSLDRGSRRGMTLASIVAACVGCALLAVRPAILSSVSHPAAVLALMLTVLLVVGLIAPVPNVEHDDGPAAAKTLGTVPAVVLGVGVFTVARMASGGETLAPATIAALLANTLAAVAEEVWFRRFVYGLLEPGGVVFAVAGSAVLFAAVHVTTYGWWVLPLDVAAGLVLGWQRAATRSWHASAITHVFANLLVLL